MYKIRKEWTIREVLLAPDILSTRWTLLRWFAVSMGLISPNDRREGVLFLLDGLMTYWFVRGEEPGFDALKHHVARRYLEKGLSPPTDEALRKHLRKLTNMGFLRREEGRYVLNVDPRRPDDPLTAIDTVFDQILSAREVVKAGFSHLKNLYL